MFITKLVLLYVSTCQMSLCALDSPDGIPDPTGVVNTNEAFCTVIRSRLGTHSLLFSGEVDCTDPRSPSPNPPACYVELKTSKVMHSPAQRRNFYRCGREQQRGCDPPICMYSYCIYTICIYSYTSW